MVTLSYCFIPGLVAKHNILDSLYYKHPTLHVKSLTVSYSFSLELYLINDYFG